MTREEQESMEKGVRKAMEEPASRTLLINPIK
jgi:hypothetical protein